MPGFGSVFNNYEYETLNNFSTNFPGLAGGPAKHLREASRLREAPRANYERRKPHHPSHLRASAPLRHVLRAPDGAHSAHLLSPHCGGGAPLPGESHRWGAEKRVKGNKDFLVFWGEIEKKYWFLYLLKSGVWKNLLIFLNEFFQKNILNFSKVPVDTICMRG